MANLCRTSSRTMLCGCSSCRLLCTRSGLCPCSDRNSFKVRILLIRLRFGGLFLLIQIRELNLRQDLFFLMFFLFCRRNLNRLSAKLFSDILLILCCTVLQRFRDHANRNLPGFIQVFDHDRVSCGILFLFLHRICIVIQILYFDLSFLF